MKDYFAYCPECGIEDGLTKEQALIVAKDHINCFLDDSWSEGVDDVMVGKITHVTKMVNKVEKPTDIDEDGYSKSVGIVWNKNWDYMCDYVLDEVDSEVNIDEDLLKLKPENVTISDSAYEQISDIIDKEKEPTKELKELMTKQKKWSVVEK